MRVKRLCVELSTLYLFAAAACSGDEPGKGASAGSAGAGGASGPGSATTTGTAGGSATSTTAGSGGGSGSGGSSGSGSSGSGGGVGGSGGSGSGGSGGSGGGGMTKPPVPPGPGNVPRPSGAAANLKVLPWAGFKAAVTYTFDDSQPSQVDHYADLKATSVPVTYYITTVNGTYPGYDATWKDAAASGSELGNHTVNHCYANLNCPTGQPLATVGAEIDQATDYIKTKLGAPGVYTIAYPYGDSNYRSEAQSRFFLGRIAGPASTNGMVAPGDGTDPFLLPVIPAAGGESASKFSGDIDSARTQGKWVSFLFHSLLPTTQNWYAGVDIGAVTGSIAHAKSLSDVWIDTVANVGAYWMGQKTLQVVMPTSEGGRTTWTWKLPAHFPPGRILRVTVEGGTLTQNAATLPWDVHGYYEVALDAGTLTWAP